MNNLPPSLWIAEDFADLERLVSSAKDFVVPSDDLRPRVVEAARDIDVRRAELTKLRNFGICMAGLWVSILGLFWVLAGYRDELSAPTSEQVQRQALEYSAYAGTNVDWALVETFRQLRGGDDRSH
ncbi:MAG: hypothetical protein KF752_11015 [Pirellulaceae bacterium]|nr:hypothetical protein [Pirellulaceae bacterium]